MARESWKWCALEIAGEKKLEASCHYFYLLTASANSISVNEARTDPKTPGRHLLCVS